MRSPNSTMFNSILIANRGEIACRVIRTAKRMGLRCIAVYSEADANALHVEQADEAVLIGPAAARESYLSIQAVLAAAQQTGAGAVHPGYGFLAENPEFAEACESAGVVFIGPPAEAMRKMAHKDEAKAMMAAAGVPVVPGVTLDFTAPDAIRHQVAEIGYPILLKPIAGGGGKGMRRVVAADGLVGEIEAARREAASAFGDDRLLAEKFIERPRHIEVQIFADGHGNLVHLHERDCSIQRRYQKIVEEAPAPGLPEMLRRQFGETAIQAAAAVDYRGAGTVEFILDAEPDAPASRLYFMEMNTRLQVEHPVTEMITGEDLVEWQIRVAQGEALLKTQDEIAVRGHAIEARVYAEDALRGFIPTAGTISTLVWPARSEGLRIETGVRRGDEIGVHYDPMIAKLVAWGEDREQAIAQLAQGLASAKITGPTVNLDFLAAVLAQPEFQVGDVETGFVARHLPALALAASGITGRMLVTACLFLRAIAPPPPADDETGDIYSPWRQADGWRTNLSGGDRFEFALGDKAELPHLEVEIAYQTGNWRFETPVGELTVDDWRIDGDRITATIDGVAVEASVTRDNRVLTIVIGAARADLYYIDPRELSHRDEEITGDLMAPLPGKIVRVEAAPGAVVRKGETLLVMEAMKMEYTITAPGDSIVEAVHCGVGDQVDEGVVLIEFAASEGHPMDGGHTP